MATILTADLPSDESEDEDFEPTEDKPAKKAASGRKRQRWMGEAPPAGADKEVPPQQGSALAEEEPHPEQVAKKARAAALWEQLNQQQPAKQPSGSKDRLTKPPLSLAQLCQPVKRVKQKADDKQWMAQLGLLSNKAATKLGTTKEPVHEIGTAEVVDGSRLHNVAASALAAAKSATSVLAGQQHGRVAVTEMRRFAGQHIQVTKSVAMGDNKDAEARKKAGLDAFLAGMQAAKTVNVLDKSRADWTEFKTSNEEVEHELETYKKSGDKYLDKVDFLQRADVRQYEKERDERLAADPRNRGRL